MVPHEEIGQERGGAHSYAIHLVVEFALKQKVGFFGSKTEKPLNPFPADVF